jgi:capping protein alpha
MTDAPSAETQLQIATYFLSLSPSGEVDQVLADVQKLVDSSVLNDDVIASILAKYNVEQMTPSKDPEGNGILVSEFGQVSQNEFVDPNTGRILEFNHRTRKFVKDTGKKAEALSADSEAYRAAFQKAAGDYLSKHFKPGKGVVTVYGQNGSTHVCISAVSTKLSAYWTGGWKSQYSIDTSSKKTATLKGNVKVNVHYFEDGNVQLHTNLDKSSDITVGDPTSTGEAVAKAIMEIESNFQNAMEEKYVAMEPTFKNIRRFLPISGTKMNWNMAAHSLLDQK